MPIDLDRAIGWEFPAVTSEWTPRDVIVYHLGIGAGRSTDRIELPYVYEAHLEVLPTFGVVPSHAALEGLYDVPGMDIDPAMLLHGEQEVSLKGPIPTQASTTTRARIAGIYDRGSGAVIAIETDTSDSDGRTIFVNRYSLFVRGEGGFGGDSGPRHRVLVPERPPDYVVESPTSERQAVLYRLSGDLNPLHIDPDVAERAGFDRPILHGLCSFGVVGKAVADVALDGEAAGIRAMRARFAGVVFPGETVTTQMWRVDDEIVLLAAVKERQTPVLSNAVVSLS